VTRSVTVVTTIHPPDDPRIRYKGIESLRRAGWAITYVCRSPGPSASDGITVRILSGNRLARFVRAGISMVNASSALIIVHDPELLIWAIPLAMVRGRTRVVFDLHEDLPKQMATRYRYPRALRPVLSALAGLALRMAERVMTVTLAEPQYASIFRDDHAVFENLPITEELPTRVDADPGVVYVGDISLERGAMVLLAAVSELEDVPLTMIGRCPPALAAELQRQARTTGVDLTMTGFLPYRDAWTLACRSTVGVSPLQDLPNYRDSLPTKLLEYRCVGLVAIASRLPGSERVLEGSQVARTFTAGDPIDLARAIAETVDDPTALAIAVAEADQVRASWSWDADGFVAFLDELITSSRG